MVEDDVILLVEDSPEDYETTTRALSQAGLANQIVHCADGEVALDYLYQRGAYASIEPPPRPNVILLDLNLPETDGLQVLAEIKQDDHLRHIPVIVLTTSADERDIEKCYQAGANSYVKKPVDVEGFFRAVRKLKAYWFEIAILPKVIHPSHS